jgi:hypothetical protein
MEIWLRILSRTLYLNTYPSKRKVVIGIFDPQTSRRHDLRLSRELSYVAME